MTANVTRALGAPHTQTSQVKARRFIRRANPLRIAVVILAWGPCAAIGAADLPAASGDQLPHAAALAEVAEPSDYRTDRYREPVPKTLKGARVITPDDAETLHKDKSAVFVDVYPRAPKPPNLPAGTIWRDPPHNSIDGAHWLPNVGYGVLSDDFETYFKTRLEALTAGDLKRPVVFFCLKDCWMSWNAAKRALTWGYSSVIWYPDGTDGWQALGNDLVPSTPVP